MNIETKSAKQSCRYMSNSSTFVERQMKNLIIGQKSSINSTVGLCFKSCRLESCAPNLKANSHDARFVVTTCTIQLISHRVNAKITQSQLKTKSYQNGFRTIAQEVFVMNSCKLLCSKLNLAWVARFQDPVTIH